MHIIDKERNLEYDILSYKSSRRLGGRIINLNKKELERYGYGLRDSEEFKRQVHAYYHIARKHEIRIWCYNDLFVIANIKLSNKDQEDA